MAHVITLIYVSIFGSWILIPYTIFGMLVFHIGHGVFAHRYFTHKMFDLSTRAQLIGHVLFCFVNWGSATTFAAIHAQHHAHTGTEQDPHDYRHVGFWKTFFGQYNLNYNSRVFKQNYKKPFAKFFHRNYFTILYLGMPFMAPVVALCFWMRAIAVISGHCDFGDTSKRRGKDTSTNLSILYPILWGEENHSEHHNNATNNRLHRYDLIYWLGLLLRKI